MRISSEEIFYEGGPAKGDLIINLLAGITIIGLPFTFAALVRALWLRFKITNKTVTVVGGWLGKNKTQISYSQVKEIRSVPRGLGSWGDIVLVLSDSAKIEMRSVPNFRETEKYLIEKINLGTASVQTKNVQGFAALNNGQRLKNP